MQAQMIQDMPLVEFELLVANKYRGKVDNAKSRGIDFALTLNEFRNLLLKKRCAYTGIPLTLHKQGHPVNADLTIERVDSNKGYVRGNVIAVCSAANSVKGVLEDPNTFLSVNDAIRMFAKIGQLQKEMK
jgi:hypothetical protein